MITAGSAIGAGIFSLPIAASGMWFPLSIISLIAVWVISYLATLMLLEVNMQYEPGTSFNTFTKEILGNTWNIVSGLSIAFLLYIFLYAYFSAFGNIAAHTYQLIFNKEAIFSQRVLSLILGGILAFFVWKSTKMVGRISAVLIVGMVISFCLTVSGLSIYIEGTKLFESSENILSKVSYIWSGLPYFLSACAFMSMVPSLYKFYGKNPKTIKTSLFYGALLSLLVYIAWLVVAFGVIPRTDFVAINAAGGNMGDLVNGLEQNAAGTAVSGLLNFFSNLAIVSSFFGAGLSLFDYIADSFKLGNGLMNRFYTACITFVPPAIASFFFPHGFIAAIGFAGIVVVFMFFILPFAMVWKTRKLNVVSSYRLQGGKILLIIVLVAGLIIGFSQSLSMLGYLPKY